ncbi:NUDIX hydrolase [Candidatus Saccharibacteria bacterium]|nr:NUDIX hydrolase [Candidatus Saccharibacteria bacterium]MBH1972517.1 NUDIX hydrolase [Candidatus Saccharibacteria bacterium]MBH1990719.1 NUDIX hydrolase [Candidatus Saccharibacteria bacterium]
MYPNAFYRVNVKALIRDDNGRILVVKENQDTRSLPGGGLDHGEEAEEGIRRELKEELGIQDANIAGINQTRTLELKTKQVWLLWIVYDVSVNAAAFHLGDGVSDSCYIDPGTLKSSKNVFEQLVYKVAVSS